MRFAVIAVASTLAAAVSVLAQQVPLDTVTVALHDMVRERVLDGVVEPVRESTVSAQTAGRIAEIQFDVDDFVPRGAVILRLRDTEQRARVAQAEADVRRAEAAYVEAQENFKRISDLFDRKVVSRADFDSAKARLDSTKAASESSRAALEQAQEQLEYTVIRAPFAGVVTARHVEVGETASVGQALMSGFSLEQLRVRVDVPQRTVNAIRSTRRARVVRPDDREGEIRTEDITVFPYASEGSNTFRVRVNLPPRTADLYPGMLVKVAFEVGREQRLVVPRQAVLRRSEVVGVYVVKQDGTVSLRQIRPGRDTDDAMIEVLAGLEPGERIAVDALKAAVYLKTAAGT